MAMAYKVYNYQNDRIGDKVAVSALIQHEIEEYGHQFVLIDPKWDDFKSFPIRQFFPQISKFVLETRNPEEAMEMCLGAGFERLETGNLWITVPSLKLDTGFTPTMFLPPHAKKFAETITANYKDGTSKRIIDHDIRIVNHCLVDAPYNPARNHDANQWFKFLDRVKDYLEQNKINGIIVDVPPYEWSFQQVIALISLSNIFIGGDTGSTHVAGALKKNIVAIYGNSDHDVKAFHEQKEREGRSSEWNSDPLSDTYKKFVMTDHKFNEDEVFEHLRLQIENTLNNKVVV